MKTNSMSVLMLIAALALSGCTVTLTVDASWYVRPTTFRSATEPPPPLREDDARGTKPDPDAVWVTGHWDWQGSWVWVPGAWKKPEPNHEWEPPVCVAYNGDYRFYPGYFRPRDEEPPPVYREPGHIQVHVPDAARPAPLPDRVVVVPGQAPPENTARPELADTQPNTDPTRPDGLPTQQPEVGRPDVAPPDTVEGGNPQTALSCRLTITRVPRSAGNFTIEGSGFTDDVVVKVGGSTQTIRLRTDTQIQARTSSAGMVKVVRGSEEAECGRLELF